MTSNAEQMLVEDQSLTVGDIKRLSAEGRPIVLRNCDLQDLNMADLDLSDWTFERCTLFSASFSGAMLERSIFGGCRTAGANFISATLTEARIEGGDFSNTKFCGARLNAASISHCKMTGADFSDAKTIGVELSDVLFVLALLPRFSFRKMVLKQINFTDADLRSGDFREAIFEDCSLRDAHLADCRFEKADLRGADLGGVRLTDAKRFKGAIISKRQAADLLGQLGLQVL